VNFLISNPEIVRNARIQLRRGRVVVAGVICAAISVITWEGVAQGVVGESGLFGLVLYFQVAVLLIGGGVYCLQSIHREKELNTFDYQRVTRLTSLEVAIGKLFGSPITAYLVVLFLMPIALVGALLGRVPISVVLEAYTILFLGCVAYHAFALVISMMLGRGGSAAAIFIFLLLVAITSVDWSQITGSFVVHRLSPFCAPQIPSEYVYAIGVAASDAKYSGWYDLFFGKPLSHPFVVIVVYVVFGAWFLVAVARNLKRDPAAYELYSPNQALAFAISVSLLVLGFFQWKVLGPADWVFEGLYARGPLPPLDVIRELLRVNVPVFFALGVVLLRNRERVRSGIRTTAKHAADGFAAIWPTPYVLVGTAAVGAAVVGLVEHYRPPESHWNWALAAFEVLFFSIWLTRDILYLQWMNLRRSKRPLLSGLLCLLAYYVCAYVFFSGIGMFEVPDGGPLTAVFVPSPLFSSGISGWNSQRGLWIAALALQTVQGLLLVLLHRRRLEGMERATAL